MNSTTEAQRQRDQLLAQAIFRRVAEDLGMVVDRRIAAESPLVERVSSKQSARSGVHLSFRLCVKVENGPSLHGCMLVPLADAITLASFLMMVPDDGVKSRRMERELDRATKDAMLEVGNFLGGATDAALREIFPKGVSARSEGCQGVKPEQRPRFEYREGDELLVARAKVSIHSFPASEFILQLPVMPESLG